MNHTVIPLEQCHSTTTVIGQNRFEQWATTPAHQKPDGNGWEGPFVSCQFDGNDPLIIWKRDAREDRSRDDD